MQESLDESYQGPDGLDLRNILQGETPRETRRDNLYQDIASNDSEEEPFADDYEHDTDTFGDSDDDDVESIKTNPSNGDHEDNYDGSIQDSHPSNDDDPDYNPDLESNVDTDSEMHSGEQGQAPAREPGQTTIEHAMQFAVHKNDK